MYIYKVVDVKKFFYKAIYIKLLKLKNYCVKFYIYIYLLSNKLDILTLYKGFGCHLYILEIL
jgi:hypothetical protein